MFKSIFKAVAVSAVAAFFCVGCSDKNNGGGEEPGDNPGEGGGTKTSYTVTFNANGGTVSPTSAKTGDDGKLDSLPTPTREGYTFDGWYTAATGGTVVPAGNVYTANTTIYARWTEKPVTPPDTANPKDTTGGGTDTTSSGTDTTGGGTKSSYTVMFDPNGGTVNPTSDTTGADGKLASLPTATRNGYDFDGWYTAQTGGTEVTDSSAYTANTTIYARWTETPVTPPTTYTVTFNVNGGGTVTPTTATTGADGKLASLPTPTRTGYTFNGWFTASTGGSEVAASMVYTANTTVYARWTAGPYTVTFNVNGGGTVAPTSATTSSDGKLASLPTPTREGYAFNGWFTASTGGTEVAASRVYTANTTIYARWVVAYTVTFDPNGGAVSSTSAKTGAAGKLASLPTPTRVGYTFGDWYTALTGGTKVTADRVYSADATIYARWGYAYTITFDAGEGTVSPTSAATDAYGVLSSLPLPTRAGYASAGWYTASTEEGMRVTTSRVYSADATIYARWIPVYTITFNANGGTVSPTSATTDASRTISSLPTPTRSDALFLGWWWTETWDAGTKVLSTYSYYDNTTLYARWAIIAPVSTFTDSRDSKSYKKVAIGEQTWMAENLDYIMEGSACYNNSPTNCATYGRLYDYASAMDACPAGWHLPTVDEWRTLTNYVDTSAVGKRLKAQSGWYSSLNSNGYTGNGGGTNDFGFSALPGGGSISGFGDAGMYGNWWATTSDEQPSRLSMYGSSNDVYYSEASTSVRISVRCVQD